MAAIRLEQVQRFILAKKIFWGYGHFKQGSRMHTSRLLTIAACTLIDTH